MKNAMSIESKENCLKEYYNDFIKCLEPFIKKYIRNKSKKDFLNHKYKIEIGMNEINDVIRKFCESLFDHLYAYNFLDDIHNYIKRTSPNKYFTFSDYENEITDIANNKQLLEDTLKLFSDINADFDSGYYPGMMTIFNERQSKPDILGSLEEDRINPIIDSDSARRNIAERNKAIAQNIIQHLIRDIGRKIEYSEEREKIYNAEISELKEYERYIELKEKYEKR